MVNVREGVLIPSGNKTLILWYFVLVFQVSLGKHWAHTWTSVKSAVIQYLCVYANECMSVSFLSGAAGINQR